MEIALIQYFPNHGYEVWITDIIDIGAGLGSVFTDHQEAIIYAKEHNVLIADLSHFEMPDLEGEKLRAFLSQYLELTPRGDIVSIKID